jgi:hypothetical protein
MSRWSAVWRAAAGFMLLLITFAVCSFVTGLLFAAGGLDAGHRQAGDVLLGAKAFGGLAGVAAGALALRSALKTYPRMAVGVMFCCVTAGVAVLEFAFIPQSAWHADFWADIAQATTSTAAAIYFVCFNGSFGTESGRELESARS